MSVDYGEWAIFDQYKIECWLRGMVHLDYNLPNVIWLDFGQVESHLIHALYEKAKNDKSKIGTRAERLWLRRFCPLSQIGTLVMNDCLL